MSASVEPSVLSRIGLSLWTMQSTARAPAHPVELYRRLARDAAVVESYGFHSLWTGEHRGWYDGWCPAPIHALSHAAAGTTRLRFGTAMLLLPQHDGASVTAAARTFDALYAGRLELGVSVGYRDAEFDAVGVRRDQRGRRMDPALAELFAGGVPASRVWIGGMADAALARAARFGCGILLPQTVRTRRLRQIIDMHRDAGGGPVGITKDVHVAEDATEFRRALRAHFREEIGSWWTLRGQQGFQRPGELATQLDRVDDSAIAGPAGQVADLLGELLVEGVDFLLLRLCYDFLAPQQLHEQIARVAEEVAPLLESGGSAG